MSKTILIKKLKAKIKFEIVMILVRDVPRPTFAIVYLRSLIELKMIATKIMEDAKMTYFKFRRCSYFS